MMNALSAPACRHLIFALCAAVMLFCTAGARAAETGSLPQLTAAAKSGDAEAQLALAKRYRLGQGVPKDPALAIDLLKKASKAGNEEASFMLAEAYYKGDGTEQNFKEAARILRTLADKGNPVAAHYLGIMYARGEGVKKSDVEAAAWLALSANRYKAGKGQSAAIRELDTIREKIDPDQQREAETLYRRRIDALIRSGLAPAQLAPDQTDDNMTSAGIKKPGLSGFLQAGLRRQTNANSAASSYLNNPTPPASSLPIKDTNMFLLAGIVWNAPMDLGAIRGIETGVTLYKTYQNDSDVVDLSYAEASVGPNIVFGAAGKNNLRPYLSGSFVEADNNFYQAAGTVGIDYTRVFTRNTVMILSAEESREVFRASQDAPDNSDLSGNKTEVKGRFVHRFHPRVTGNLSLTLNTFNAHEDGYSYNGMTLLNGYSVNFPPLFRSLSAQPVVVYGSAAFKRRLFDEPNPPLSPTIERQESEWQFTLTGSIPVSDSWAITPTLQRTQRDSNLSNYEYTNTSMSLAATFKF